jgi:hypothetical protein
MRGPSVCLLVCLSRGFRTHLSVSPFQDPSVCLSPVYRTCWNTIFLVFWVQGHSTNPWKWKWGVGGASACRPAKWHCLSICLSVWGAYFLHSYRPTVQRSGWIASLIQCCRNICSGPAVRLIRDMCCQAAAEYQESENCVLSSDVVCLILLVSSSTRPPAKSLSIRETLLCDSPLVSLCMQLHPIIVSVPNAPLRSWRL